MAEPASEAPITVLVVDDHLAFGDALRAAMRFEDGLEPIGAVGSVEEALTFCEQTVPDVILMDIDLPGTDGLAGTRAVKERYPEVHVLLLTGHTDPSFITLGADAGAVGFLPKHTPMSEVMRAVRTASEGEMLVPASMLAAVIRERKRSDTTTGRHAKLTEREIEVLKLLGEGKDPRGIARALTIEVSTVRGHVKAILRKLNAHTQLEAVVIAARTGLIDVGQSANS